MRILKLQTLALRSPIELKLRLARDVMWSCGNKILNSALSWTFGLSTCVLLQNLSCSWHVMWCEVAEIRSLIPPYRGTSDFRSIIQIPCIYRNFCAFRRKNAGIYDVFATSRTKLAQNTAIYSVFWWMRRKHCFLRCFCDKALNMYRKNQCFLHFYYFQLSKQTF